MSAFVDAAVRVRDVYAKTSDLGLIPVVLDEALAELLRADPTDVARPAARFADPITSHRAAASVRMRSSSQRARLLRPFSRHADLTADEAWSYTSISETSCYWKRVSELAAAELIEPTGETRKGRAGEPQTVYRITDAGRTVLAGLS